MVFLLFPRDWHLHLPRKKTEARGLEQLDVIMLRLQLDAGSPAASGQTPVPQPPFLDAIELGQ